MFPYPSGAGLTCRPSRRVYSKLISFSTYEENAEAIDALHPIGWDAFGLPAEQYAIDTGNDPSRSHGKQKKTHSAVKSNHLVSHHRDREINTTDPEYYKWTQWIFLKLI